MNNQFAGVPPMPLLSELDELQTACFIIRNICENARLYSEEERKRARLLRQVIEDKINAVKAKQAEEERINNLKYLAEWEERLDIKHG